jgi:hypothetical protein
MGSCIANRMVTQLASRVDSPIAGTSTHGLLRAGFPALNQRGACVYSHALPALRECSRISLGRPDANHPLALLIGGCEDVFDPPAIGQPRDPTVGVEARRNHKVLNVLEQASLELTSQRCHALLTAQCKRSQPQLACVARMQDKRDNAGLLFGAAVAAVRRKICGRAFTGLAKCLGGAGFHRRARRKESVLESWNLLHPASMELRNFLHTL